MSKEPTPINRLLEMPDEHFETVLDLFRVYGSTYVPGVITTVAELRLTKFLNEVTGGE